MFREFPLSRCVSSLFYWLYETYSDSFVRFCPCIKLVLFTRVFVPYFAHLWKGTPAYAVLRHMGNCTLYASTLHLSCRFKVLFYTFILLCSCHPVPWTSWDHMSYFPWEEGHFPCEACHFTWEPTSQGDISCESGHFPWGSRVNAHHPMWLAWDGFYPMGKVFIFHGMY